MFNLTSQVMFLSVGSSLSSCYESATSNEVKSKVGSQNKLRGDTHTRTDGVFYLASFAAFALEMTSGGR